MRIIAGKARGTKLYTLEGENTRPTLDRVKESLFNIIQSEIPGSIFLDLFSGSGAIGLEAVSRGAKKAILCDTSKEACAIIKKNIEKTHTSENVELYQADFKEVLTNRSGDKFDIIYLDPPYKTNFAIEAIKIILDKELLKESASIIIETTKIWTSISYILKKDIIVERGKTMEIFTLLETLEDLLERSRNLPFSSKSVVDKEEILDLIKEIRLKLPDELKQAKWIKEERQRILAEAQKEADGIVKEAENRIIAMIDEHEITRKAYDQKTEIIETANEMSREISKGTKEYADSLLGNTEDIMKETLEKLETNMSEALKLMEISLQDTIKTIQNSRK